MEVRLAIQNTFKRDRFKYLESIIQRSGDIGNDITHCIGATAVVQSTLLYETEYWSIKKSDQVQKIYVVEMRMLRWMCGHTSSNKIRNEDIRNKMGVASVLEKMREAKLR
ncbi:hypothetical protein H5410_035543 [Solanum commersonii]|uniref:Uncharacterized protein n=1 Tax=Solanum commersonii TaxID=4109 RepID=A0A9J5Y362_SOLCO|nr:hypothetical protein H5410_035543 [Solanum commersonii]